MGRGSSTTQSARELLYGSRPRGSGPKQALSAGEELARLAALAPSLPDDLFEDELLFGDSRYDKVDWLNRFATEALINDAFSDTVVEETIVDEIDKGEISNFTAKRWAEPHRGEKNYQEARLEGKAMKEVIDLYQESDLPVSRITLSAATNRFALKVALGRLASGETEQSSYSWRELQALTRLEYEKGAAERLAVTVPSGLATL